MKVDLVCRLEAQLGEGPVWLADKQELWFVDIKLGRLHCHRPRQGGCATLDVGGQPSFIVPTDRDSLLVGSGGGIHELAGDRLGPALLQIDQPAHNRTNDATVDESGRLWFGTMDDREQESTGAVYCFDQGNLTRTHLEAVVTNGPAVCGSGDWLYHVDSGQRTIWRVPLNNGFLAGEGEPFVRLTDEEGYPDGVVVDSENCLWVALWDGWGVRRYSPNGELLCHIDVPCARVTKVAFGGADLRTAYVTTARVGLNDEQLAKQPLAGSLFAFTAKAPGRMLPPVRLPA